MDNMKNKTQCVRVPVKPGEPLLGFRAREEMRRRYAAAKIRQEEAQEDSNK